MSPSVPEIPENCLPRPALPSLAALLVLLGAGSSLQAAPATFRRSVFGMTYSVDNGWVGDAVELIVEFEARRK